MLRARNRRRPVVEDPETVLSSWIYGSNCCPWRGLRCDKLAGGEVVRLDASDGLMALTHLDLTYNSFGAVIPHTNGSLERLKLHLNLASCGFCGVISESQYSPIQMDLDSVLKNWIYNLQSLSFCNLS
eukprot:Gb_05195 [translate_table: standard]